MRLRMPSPHFPAFPEVAIPGFPRRTDMDEIGERLFAVPSVVEVIVAILVGVPIAAGILLLCARVAGIQNRTFGKALATTVIAVLASYVLAVVIGLVPGVTGTVLGYVAGFLASVLITMGIFRTTFGRALVTQLMTWVVCIIVFSCILLAIQAVRS
jgi:hypothetical protein